MQTLAAKLAALWLLVPFGLAQAQDLDSGVIQSVDVNGQRDVIQPRALLRIVLGPGAPASITFHVDGAPVRLLVVDKQDRLVEAPEVLQSETPMLEVRDASGKVLGRRALRRLHVEAPARDPVSMSLEQTATGGSVLLAIEDERFSTVDVRLYLNDPTPRLRLRHQSRRGVLSIAPEGNVWTPGVYILELLAPQTGGAVLTWERNFVVRLDGTLAGSAPGHSVGREMAARYAHMFRDLLDAVLTAAPGHAALAQSLDDLRAIRPLLSKHCRSTEDPAPGPAAYRSALRRFNELRGVPFPYSTRLCTIAGSLLAAARGLLVASDPDLPTVSTAVNLVLAPPTANLFVENLLAALAEIDSTAKGW